MADSHAPIPGITGETWSRARDFITILLVPALGWVILQVASMSRMEVEISTLKGAVQEQKENIQYLRDRDSNTATQIAKLEARFDAFETVLVELKKSIDKIDRRVEKMDERLDYLSSSGLFGPQPVSNPPHRSTR